MAVITLFDKSFIQSLSVDESVWFDQFFVPVVSPLFFVETLADLEKRARAGWDPEREVAAIADKFPEMHAAPCVHHGHVALAELLGCPIPMNGRIPRFGGRRVRSGSQSALLYDQTPEAEAFLRWQERQFLELERNIASLWRKALGAADLRQLQATFRSLGIDGKTCGSLDRAAEIARAYVRERLPAREQMKFAVAFLGYRDEVAVEVLARHEAAEFPPIIEYAPYTAHILTVEFFFQVAIAASLISPERASNRVDVAYLFYLPFCQVFVSADNLHARTAALFLRQDQQFLSGADMKRGLAELNNHYRKLPFHEREKGLNAFAPVPPQDSTLIVPRIWDQHLPGWRDPQRASLPLMSPEQQATLIEHLKAFDKSPAAETDTSVPYDPDVVSVQHFVHKKKGSWYQLPKDLEERDDEDED